MSEEGEREGRREERVIEGEAECGNCRNKRIIHLCITTSL